MQQSGRVRADGHGVDEVAEDAADPVAGRLRDARKKLIETGTRNRLIHTPRGAKKSRSVALSVSDADAFFDTAARSHRAMRFIPEAAGRGEVAILAAHDKRSGAGWLYSTLEAEALEKKLLTLHRDAKTAEEEQGINILFLAFGFLRWFEDGKSDVVREAPLILLPVQLVRDRVRSGFDLKAREEEIVTNEALQERLRSDFAIHLPDIPEGDEWRPAAYFAAVRQVIASKPAWSVDEAGIELGFYSFAKLLMIKDLEPAAWPGASILEHEALKSLLVDGFQEEEPLYADDVRLDQAFSPADLVQVVDADASQTLVIETVRAGRNLVVQGPPGTGKSQTIANIVAAAVHDGRTVLFVAEKMVALEVVHERLQKAGIGQVCLQLHSRATNKRLLAEELGRTLALDEERLRGSDGLERLVAARDRLNASAAALHTPVAKTGVTPFQALGALAAATGRAPVAQAFVDEASTLDVTTFREAKEAAERLATVVATAGPAASHPWAGVGAIRLQPTELERILSRLTDLAAAAGKLATNLEQLGTALGGSSAASLESAALLLPVLEQAAALSDPAALFAAMLAHKDRSTVLSAIDAGRTFLAARTAFDELFSSSAQEVSTQPLRAAILPGKSSFFARWGGAYRRASRDLAAALRGPLPRTAADRLELIDKLAAFQEARGTFATISHAMERQLAERWADAATDFDALAGGQDMVDAVRRFDASQDVDRVLVLRSAGDLNQRTSMLRAAVGDLDTKLAEVMRLLAVDTRVAFEASDERAADPAKIAARCGAWIAARLRYDEWSRLSQAQSRLGTITPAFAAAVASGAIPHYELPQILHTAWSEAVWNKALTVAPLLRDFEGAEHDRSVEEFQRLDVARRATCASEIRSRHAHGMPRGAYGPMAVIRGEVGRKTRHMAIRRLIREAGSTLQRIKPVFLMSPISVAQYLAPGAVSFDLLVVDEASQIRPEDALGLVARAKQIVVVGDKKQLPPTSFFARMTADEEDDEDEGDSHATAMPKGAKSTEMESILSLCEARGLPGRMLRWHYRSRHPSLIEVSNAEFYRHLVMPPAPESERGRSGLVLRRVAGAYDRGGKRTNAIEAEAIAKAVASHAKSDPGQTLGIVTFSTVQRDAVTDALENMRRSDDRLDAYLAASEGGGEEVFVKSLENVQGDERDVILVSVGYGPRIAGTKLDSMAFGPVSAEGGERRLNVLFTRARLRCEIFVSFGAGDIDPSRARGEGPRVLKRFLQYAETGVLEERLSVGEDFDSPFEADVAAAIERMGYAVEKQIGSAGFKIDLAVRHPDEPGRFMIAVECDGATYHSALWARERDRLRQEVLENLGWRFYRVWSTDWFYRRGLQLEKLRAALLEAVENATRAAVVEEPPAPAEPIPSVAPPPTPAPPPPSMPAYRLANPAAPAGYEPHEAPLSRAAEIVLEIIHVEGPILQDEIGRRFATAFCKERTGTRIAQAVDRALKRLQAKGEPIHLEANFWMTPEQRDLPPVRDRSHAPMSLQKAESISPRELRAAIGAAEEDNGPLPPDAMAVAAARLFGFQRAGPDFKAAIRREMELHS